MPDPISHLNAALQGRYRVERQLGEGGTATVYLAEDLKHGRKVALKVLKPDLAAVVGSERFLGEIRTTANLQHPHILPLHDSGEVDGFLYYVMPHVEGESLRERLDNEHQLPIDEAVRIATNVAEALDYAHRQGVIHRDIKPANILLLDGKPVVADFGIALAVSHAGSSRLTATGLSLGTPHYMSPEQATGDQAVGPATDIWALGCVLYEMLAGEPPYVGSTPQAVLGKIITAEPASVTEARRSVPLNVDAAIRKALEKLPADRFATAQEFAEALIDTAFRQGERGESASRRRDRSWHPASLATGAAATLVVVVAWLLLRQEPVLRVERFPDPFLPGEAPVVATGSFDLSADGTMLAYQYLGVDGAALMVRRWTDLAGTPVRETRGASQPVFSPDGASLAFVQEGQVRALDLGGGPVRTLGPGVAPYWAPDGYVYARVRDAVRYPAGGGPAEVVSPVEEGEGGRRIHSVLPGSRRALLGLTPGTGIEMRTIDLATGETRFLGLGEQPRYARSGHLLYLADQTLMAVRFDPDRAEITGPATPIAAGVAYYSLADDGRLFYSSTAGGARRVQLVWVTKSGEVSPVDATWTFDQGVNEAWSLSPDERRLAVRERGSDGSYDIWVKDIVRGTRTTLTNDEGNVLSPVWTSDSLITYASIPRLGAAVEVRSRRVDGIGDPQPIAELVGSAFVVTAGGGALVFGTGAAQDISWLRPGIDSEPRALLAEPGHQERDPTVSPDGRWIAYASNESGALEVYVRPFPDVASGRWLISLSGGNSPRWSLDGRELFFRARDRTMMAVGIRSGATFDHDPPRPLFPIPDDIDVGVTRLAYEVSRDGRFVMSRSVDTGEPGATPDFVLVTDFYEELHRLAPN